jgi:hypothetical protein
MINPNGILYIEPSRRISELPVIDELTRKMTAAFRRCEDGTAFRGWHTCACGAASDNCEHILPNKIETNSLCIHYLAFHRTEIPAAELEKVQQLPYGETEPNERELAAPRQKQHQEKRPLMR